MERLQTSPNTHSLISSSLVAQFAYLASELCVLGVVVDIFACIIGCLSLTCLHVLLGVVC